MMKRLAAIVPLIALVLLLFVGSPAQDEKSLKSLLPGTWRGVHNAMGRFFVASLAFEDKSSMNLKVDFASFQHAIKVQEKDGALTGYDLGWFALTAKEVGEAQNGTLKREEAVTDSYQGGGGVHKKITAGNLGMCVQQTHEVSLNGDIVTFRGVSARCIYNLKKYSTDTFYGRLIPPGLIVGTAYSQGKAAGFFQLWKEGAVLPRPAVPEKGKIHHITCIDNSNYHYTCYVPARYTHEKPAPVVIHDDAGGGASPLSTKMADELGWIMVGLTEARNGPYPPSGENRDAALFDLRRRFNIDMTKLYFSGLSGGARRASLAAATYADNCAGVLCIVAGINFTNPPLAVPMAFITGDGDFNLGEVEDFYAREKKRGRKAMLIRHKGGHDSGGPENIENAIRWLSKTPRGVGIRDRGPGLLADFYKILVHPTLLP